jgi:hypothetical protein
MAHDCHVKEKLENQVVCKCYGCFEGGAATARFSSGPSEQSHHSQGKGDFLLLSVCPQGLTLLALCTI